MLKKTITYTDYDGTERKEDYYFNLNKAELMEMYADTEGGLDKMLQRIVDTQDRKRIMAVFKDIIIRAYGEKSLDGKRLMKFDANGNRLAMNFLQTEAYNELFMELMDAEKAAAFINAVIPKDLAEEAARVQ